MKKVWFGIVVALAVALGMNSVALISGVNAATDTDTKKATKTTYVTKKACTDGSTKKSKATVKDGQCSGGKYDGSVIVTRVTLSQCGGKSKTKDKKGEECAEGRYVGAKIVAAGTKISSKVCTNNGGATTKKPKKNTYVCTGGTLDGFAISQAATKENSDNSSSSSGSRPTQSLTYKAESGGGSGIASFGTSTTGSERASEMVSSVGGDDGGNLMTHVQRIINVVIGVVGVIAVVIIIVGGISFTTSQGEAAKVAKARNTILYGIVGLVIAILAFAIVNFVLGAVFGS